MSRLKHDFCIFIFVQVRKLVQRLQEKLAQTQDSTFYLFKVLRAHILPLTNVAFNKSGSR